MEQDKLPARQMLRITHRPSTFIVWLENSSGSNVRSIRLEFLTRLYFSNLYTPKNTSKIYIAQYTEIENAIQRLEDLIIHLPPDQSYNRLSLDLRLRQMKLTQEWMREIKTQFHIFTEETL